jgi:hypothetical protein
MTTTQQIYLDRLRAIRAPKRASIGISGSVAGAAGAPVPITADQGPLPDGGNLGQQPMPNMQSGIVPGRNRMSIGNSARGNIDLGSFLSARPNQDAINQLAQNPLAQVDPYKATTGVGGFFRRLLGDDANERNEMAAGQRGQMLAQKWLMDQRNQGQMGLIDKEHQYAMERAKAQIEADNARQTNADQTALQRLRLQDQNNLGLEGMRAVNDLIGKSQDQSFRARQGALERDVTMRGQDLTSEVGLWRNLAMQRDPRNNDVIPPGGMRLGDKIYLPDDNGNMREFTGGVPAQGGGLDPAALANVAAKFQAVDKQNAISAASQPPTVLGGAVEAIKDVPQMYNQAAIGLAKDAMSSPLMQQMTAPLTAGYNQFVAPKLDLLKQYQLLKNKQKLQQLGVTNSPSLTLP